MDRKAEFDRYMIAIANGCGIVEENISSEAKQTIIEHGHWAYQKVKEMFNDECNNLGRWLSGEPCLVKHPYKKETYAELDIGCDCDTLYYFLEYCKRMNTGEEIGNLLLAQVALSIVRNQSNKKDDPIEKIDGYFYLKGAI